MKKVNCIIIFLLLQFCNLSAAEINKEDLINIKAGTLITEIIEKFGEPDINEPSTNNYRYPFYKIADDKFYSLVIAPNGSLIQLSVVNEDEKNIIFFDEISEDSENDMLEQRIIKTKLGITRAELYQRIGKLPEDYKNTQIIEYKMNNRLYKFYFTDNNKLWKIQKEENNKKIPISFDIRILNDKF